ncbi:MAG TPA: NAD+ synthase [Anaerolineae bacterium]|nr:NAD+ synthase [Caldilineae bacterium]HID33803.1 NAD+ synthase [Anaerolineae bacterium]HIQ11250.1 NAD+ synthase [Caldilineales bacterium]
MRILRLALAQINVIVGDIEGNAQKIRDRLEKAREERADLVLFPELTITGYPPEDLLLKPDFIATARQALDDLLPATAGLTAALGLPIANHYDLFNAAAFIQDGQLLGIYPKHYLPNYGVFDENRYFGAGKETLLFDLAGDRVGLSICEDIWYPGGPPQWQALMGAELLLNISASPYARGKGAARERMMRTRAMDNVAFVAYCNLVGGQDELVFDGRSLVFGPDGRLLARGPMFEEGLLVVDIDLDEVFRRRLHDPRYRQNRETLWALTEEGETFRTLSGKRISRGLPKAQLARASDIHPAPDPVGEVYQALVLGTRDYVRKNGFRQVVLGLSGGIDSSLTATIAVDALGAENVVGVSMPSRFSSEHSKSDARQLADNLGIRFLTVPIEKPFAAMLETLNGPPDRPFQNTEFNVAEENIQARLRGVILMALSNKFGWLLLSTGNKSENAVGYATLYGDMAGGFAVIKDVPKTLVWELARWRNAQAGRAIIPESVIIKPPSAELRPNQLDTDSLPPYPILDAILEMYIEEDRSPAEIAAAGYAPALVERIVRMVDRNEYKRRQAAPGVKITVRAFGKDRRLPITNHYRPGLE